MRIVCFDSCQFKFSQVLIDHWINLGHNVKKSVYFDPKLLPDADVVFFDFVENNLMRASHADDVLWQQVGGIQIQPPKVIARVHDIDYWTGNHLRVNWNWVNDLVFVGPHLYDLALPDFTKWPNLKVHFIKHGIDTAKFTLRKQPIATNKIVWIGNINHQKQPELALQVIAEYPEYELHIIGKGYRNWQKFYAQRFIERNNLKVFFYDWVEFVNDFLEDKSFLLSTSVKEAFGYVIGEAMAKGIKPLIHHFYGAERVWPEYLIWEKISDIKTMLQENYSSEELRSYIIRKYPLDEMLDSYDKLLI